MNSRLFQSRITRWAPAWVLLGFLSLLSCYPFVFVLFTAFKTKKSYAADPVGFPSEPTLEYMQRALTSGNMLGYLTNSLIVVSARGADPPRHCEHGRIRSVSLEI